jgi:hypothetical protein
VIPIEGYQEEAKKNIKCNILSLPKKIDKYKVEIKILF